MTVEENLWLGGYLMASPAEAKRAAEAILERYPRLADAPAQARLSCSPAASGACWRFPAP